MMKAILRLLFSAAAVSAVSLASTASAQSTPVTPLDRQLARIDLGISGSGEFTSKSQGTTTSNGPVSLDPSTTLGALITVRYIKSPLIGIEFNYDRARYTQNYVYTQLTPSGSGTVAASAVLGVQNNATEYTFGYVAHTPRYFGVQPFASAGAGVMAFRPTTGGGLGYSPQARAAYYYSLGAEELVYGSHVGLRASFRQVFALAPDFQTTYLRDHQRQITSEPTIGFFIRF